MRELYKQAIMNPNELPRNSSSVKSVCIEKSELDFNQIQFIIHLWWRNQKVVVGNICAEKSDNSYTTDVVWMMLCRRRPKLCQVNDCSLTTHSENILFSHFISEFMHLLFLYWRLALRQISNEVIWRAYILFFLIALAAETTGAVTLIRVYHLLLYKVALQDRMGGGLAG